MTNEIKKIRCPILNRHRRNGLDVLILFDSLGEDSVPKKIMCSKYVERSGVCSSQKGSNNFCLYKNGWKSL